MSTHSRRVLWLTLAACGAALVCAAVVVSNTAIERALARPQGSLLWGTTLFRVLLAIHGLVLLGVGWWSARKLSIPRVQSAGTGRRTEWKPWIVLLLLTTVALALRLWHLGSCLWFDEVITLLDFVRPPLRTIVTSFDSQNQHMLFSVLAHLSIRVFGDHGWALRLPSVLFGVASLWALFLLGRRVIGTTEALLACTLMTVSYHHIWFSQNARGYMGLLLFATLATWLWLEALSRPGFRWWMLYAIASFLGFWIHLTMVFVLAAHGLVYLIDVLRRARTGFSDRALIWKPLAAWALCASLTLQFYSLALPQFLRSAVQEGVATRSVWTNPLWWIQEALRGLQVGWSGALVVVCGGVLAAAGWASICRRNWRAALGMVAPGVLGGATMLALSHPLWPRFFLFSLGFALLIVVRGAMVLPEIVLKPLKTSEAVVRSLGLAFTGLMIVASILTLPRYYAIPKQDFTGARDFVEHHRSPTEPVIAVGLAGPAYSRYFAPTWLSAETRPEFDTLRSQHSAFWLVYTIPDQIKSLDPLFWREIQEDFKVVQVFPGSLGGGNVFVCQPGRSQSAARNDWSNSTGKVRGTSAAAEGFDPK
jgi:mannosyltransferase